LSSWNIGGILAEQSADKIFLLLNLLLQSWNLGGRGEDQLFGLTHVEQGRGAVIRKRLRQAQRLPSRGERALGDFQFQVQGTQLKISARHVGDER
jgi:hypothetical protein